MRARFFWITLILLSALHLPAVAEDAVPPIAADTPSIEADTQAAESATKGDSYSKAEREKKNQQIEEMINEDKSSSVVSKEMLESKPILAVESPGPASINTGAIKAEELPGVALDSAGISDRGITLGSNMWQNTPHGLAVRLISGLPVEIESPALRSLSSRLLLTAAEQPKKDSMMELGDQLLIDQRLVKLWNMGQWQDYGNLLTALPAAAITGNLAKNYALLQLIAGETKHGCERVEKFSRRDNPDIFWQKAQIYCALMSDKPDMAHLMHDLWKEKYAGEDAQLNILLDAINSGAREAKVKAKDLSTLHWLIVNKGNLIVNTEGLDIVDVAAQVLLLSNDNILWSKKAALAEKLALRGVIDSAKLTDIYGELAANTNMGKKILRKDDPKLSPAQRRGSNWLYIRGMGKSASIDAAIKETIEIATAINDSYEEFDTTQERRLLALAHADFLKGLIPSPDFVWFAPTAARLLILSGDIKTARLWLEAALLDQNTASKSWPYLRLLRMIDGHMPQSRALAEQWAARMVLNAPRNLEEYLGLLALQCRALGYNEEVFARDLLPKGYSAEMLKLTERKTAPAALSVVLQQAVQNNSRAEAVAYIIYMLGQTDLSQIAGQNLAQATDSLNRLGLTDEARALALESLAASGL